MKLATAATLIALSPCLAAGQGLNGKIGELISFGSCGQALCIVTGSGAHGGHYLKSAQTAGDELVFDRLPIRHGGGLIAGDHRLAIASARAAERSMTLALAESLTA